MIAAELTCRELVELVTDYLERALPGEALGAVEAHLAECGHCRDYLAQIGWTIRVARSLGEEPAPLAAHAADELRALWRHARRAG